MALRGTDLALLASRVKVARLGAFRLGFYPEDVTGPGTEEPGDYSWREVKPEDDGEEWHVVTAWSMCADKCVSSFTYAPDPIFVGETITFTDATTPANEITYWHWAFGDGAESDEQNPTHVFAHIGTYTVSLWAASPRGACSTTQTVTVAGTIVEGTVTFDDGGGPDPCVGHTVELRDGFDVVQATTVTDANGFYQFIDPTVTMIQDDAFEIYVYAIPAQGYVDTWDDSHLWSIGVTTTVDIAMTGL